jgi:hypothetical protein
MAPKKCVADGLRAHCSELQELDDGFHLPGNKQLAGLGCEQEAILSTQVWHHEDLHGPDPLEPEVRHTPPHLPSAAESRPYQP